MVIYRWILEHSDIIGLLIDFIALIVSIVLTVIIYRLERRHEKEHEAAEEKAQKIAMAEAAKVFLIDNDDEVEYLPLAKKKALPLNHNSIFALFRSTAKRSTPSGQYCGYSSINGSSFRRT